MGRRILVTRARAQSRELQAMLEAEGAEVLAIPAIAIIPPDSFASLDAALHDIVCYDWLVFTSANGVHAMAARAREIGVPIEALASVYIAAIGDATASAICALGLAIELIPPNAVAESLAAALAPHVSRKRVLLIRANVARDVLPNALIEAEAIVTIADAYQTVIPQSSIEELRAAFSKLIDAVTFTSASSVTNFIALAHAATINVPAGLKSISIGPITTQTLRENGWIVDAEAQTANMPELVKTIVKSASNWP